MKTTKLLKRAKQKIADNEQLIRVAAIARDVTKVKTSMPLIRKVTWLGY
jgi:hypothetical protein